MLYLGTIDSLLIRSTMELKGGPAIFPQKVFRGNLRSPHMVLGVASFYRRSDRGLVNLKGDRMVPQILEREQKKTSQVSGENDKRYFPRWEVNKRAEYFEERGVAFPSYTKDLSLDGASIFVLGNPPACQKVLLRIYLADKENFEAQGRIAWSRVKPAYKLFGIVFENLSNKARELIIRHAFELR